MPIRIRAARAEDAESIGRLAQQFADYLRSLGDLTEFKLTGKSYLRDGFGPSPAFAGLVAEADSQVVGYLLYHLGYDSDRAARNLFIADLYVDIPRRRQGIGLALMTEAAHIARQNNAEELIWSVYHPNTLAAAFYDRIGARRIDELFFMRLPVDVL